MLSQKIINWLNLVKKKHKLNVRVINLDKLKKWNWDDNEIGKVLIENNYPFGLIKFLDENFDGKTDFNTKEASIKIEKPDWIKK